MSDSYSFLAKKCVYSRVCYLFERMNKHGIKALRGVDTGQLSHMQLNDRYWVHQKMGVKGSLWTCSLSRASVRGRISTPGDANISLNTRTHTHTRNIFILMLPTWVCLWQFPRVWLAQVVVWIACLWNLKWTLVAYFNLFSVFGG